jgi:hypothetical protein
MSGIQEGPGDLPDAVPGASHKSDYDDEVPSQRRLRWMTQVMVMPALLGSLWSIAVGLGYWAGLWQCHRAVTREHVSAGCGAAVLALFLWLIARGKIGARRLWLNAVLLAITLPLGAVPGYRWAAESDRCLYAEGPTASHVIAAHANPGTGVRAALRLRG